MTAERSLLRWHGGKWRLAPWLLTRFPPHRRYIELFGGGGSVLLRKVPTYCDVYNDLDSEVVTLFRCLRIPHQADALRERLSLTPYARDEFEAAYEPADDPVEIAARLIIRSHMGYGSGGHNAEIKTGFRSNSSRSGTPSSRDWAAYPVKLKSVVDRMRGVVIENRPAIEVLAQHDGEDALFYADPPYMPETRSQKSRRRKIRYHAYKYEMTLDDHVELLTALRDAQGMVCLSAYPHELYEKMLLAHGWEQVQVETMADGARPRIEVLWRNPLALRSMEPLLKELEHGAEK